MAARHNFRKLTIWMEVIELAKETYSITKIFPKPETYSLTSQMQRAAVSIPSNIAEGTAKRTDKHFLQYLENGNISKESFEYLERKIQSIQGMITRFIENIEKKIP